MTENTQKNHQYEIDPVGRFIFHVILPHGFFHVAAYPTGKGKQASI